MRCRLTHSLPAVKAGDGACVQCTASAAHAKTRSAPAQSTLQVSRPWLVAVCLALAPRLTELPPALVAAAAWGAVELWEATAAGAAAAAGRATAKGMGSSKSSVSEEPSAGGAQPQPEGQGQGGVPGEARLPAAWASGVFAATEGRLGALRCGVSNLALALAASWVVFWAGGYARARKHELPAGTPALGGVL